MRLQITDCSGSKYRPSRISAAAPRPSSREEEARLLLSRRACRLATLLLYLESQYQDSASSSRTRCSEPLASDVVVDRLLHDQRVSIAMVIARRRNENTHGSKFRG